MSVSSDISVLAKLKMDSNVTTISHDQFLNNLLRLKNKIRTGLPSDVIISKCDKCCMNFPLNDEGILVIKTSLQKKEDSYNENSNTNKCFHCHQGDCLHYSVFIRTN